MNSSALKLGGCVCAVLALSLIFFALRENGDEDFVVSARETVFEAKPFPRDSNRRKGRAGRTKNPREEFEAARKRGLTEEEVRSIVEGFQEVGYSGLKKEGGRLEEFRVFRGKAWKWYGDLLAEGFGFTGEQERLVSKRLQEMGGNDFSLQLKVFAELAPGLSEQGIVPPDNTEFLEILLGTRVWIGFQKYQAWELCELSDDQMEIGWGEIEKFGQSWSAGRRRTKDFGYDKYDDSLENPFHGAVEVLSNAGMVFPLSMWQVGRIRKVKAPNASEEMAELPLLEMVKCLTAPQLKTLLLFRPAMAGRLLKELEK